MPNSKIHLRPGTPHYEYSVQLDNVRYVLEFRWSVREECFYLSLKKGDDETDIVSGQKVVLEMPYFRRSASLDKPPGAMIALDSSGQQSMPGVDDLGDRVLIYYVDEDDLG